jgi:mycofactocin radical SAM maturase
MGICPTPPEDRHQRGGDAVPSLFSFIVFRRESAGGFVFNPYLFNEIALDNMGMCILEHCNGYFSLKEITGIVAAGFSLSHNQAERYVYEAFNKFERYYAINWRQQKRKPPEPIPDSGHSWPYPKITDGQARNAGTLSAPLSVLWEVTRECNLKCKHCLIDAGKREQNEMSLEEVKKTIRQLAAMKVFKITFGGGEPLVRPDFFDILDYASRFHFGIKLTTNGILVDDNLLKRLKDTNVFSVQVSVDGLKQTHDAFRGDKNAFERATAALKAFSDAGYWTLMSTAITRYNVNELEALVDLAVQCGATSFKPSPFIPIGRGKENVEELAITLSEIKNLAKTMLRKKEEYKGIIDMQIDGLFPWLSGPCSAGISDTIEGPSRVGCSAGVSDVVITPSGDILPCPFLRNFAAGNIRKNSLKDIWNNSEIFNVFRNLQSNQLEGKCGDCEYVPHYCQGGCRAAAYIWSGNLFAPDPHCWKDLIVRV